MAKKFKQSLPLMNLEATRSPLVTDDISCGFDVGSFWNFGKNMWRCTNSTQGAAVWALIEPTIDVPLTVVLPPNTPTNNYTFGKYISGNVIPAGKTARELIIDAISATLYPTLTNPSVSISLSGTGYASLLEVGVNIPNLVATANFNRGSINPQYTAASPFRSGLPNQYSFSNFITEVNPSTSLSNATTPASKTISNGANTVSISVAHDVGVQPKDSGGGDYLAPYPAGSVGNSATITGQLPWFYGKVSSGGAGAGVNRPASNQALINSGTKVVASSTGTIIPNFGSTSDDYIWFAIPSASTSKTKWFVDALNNGNIGGVVSAGGNLFPNPDVVSINSPSSLWSGVSYKIYVSNYQTAASIMEMRNS